MLISVSVDLLLNLSSFHILMLYSGKKWTKLVKLSSNFSRKLAATLCGLRPPQNPQNTSFGGSPSPQGSHRPYILGDTTRPGHVTYVLVGVLAALLHSQTAALNRGRHLYSAGRPSRWALAHISSFFYSSPNLSRRRLDVYHTSTHGVALVRI